jgi:hypothetical protein
MPVLRVPAHTQARHCRVRERRFGHLALVQGRKAGTVQHDKQAWHAMLAGLVEERGQKPGASITCSRFKVQG